MSYICENCGKLVEDQDKFGSGRFCSRACANSHKHSDEWKAKISAGIKKETECECQFCGKKFNNLTAKASHERLCKLNPNKLENKLGKKNHQTKLASLYKTSRGEQLDVTNSFIEDYLDTHKKCEICGRTIEETVIWENKNAPKRLCIDHDHKTLKFRGVLCSVCNRQLGWYEANKDAINNYLEKTTE